MKKLTEKSITMINKKEILFVDYLFKAKPQKNESLFFADGSIRKILKGLEDINRNYIEGNIFSIKDELSLFLNCESIARNLDFIKEDNQLAHMTALNRYAKFLNYLQDNNLQSLDENTKYEDSETKDIPIFALELSIRLYRLLLEKGIVKIGDFSNYSTREMFETKIFSNTEYKRTKSKLEKFGIFFSDQCKEPIKIEKNKNISVEMLDINTNFLRWLWKNKIEYINQFFDDEGMYTNIIPPGHSSHLKKIVSALSEKNLFFNKPEKIVLPMGIDAVIFDIKHLDFSKRTFNALSNNGILIIDDMLKMSKDELWKIPNIGKKSLKEIDEKLSEIDLCVNFYEKNEKINKHLTMKVLPKELKQISINELDLGVIPYNCLKNNEITTLQELTELTKNEVENIPNLGKKSLKDITAKLLEYGLSFKDE